MQADSLLNRLIKEGDRKSALLNWLPGVTRTRAHLVLLGPQTPDKRLVRNMGQHVTSSAQEDTTSRPKTDYQTALVRP